MIRGKRVLVVEDGPTLTHGEMKIGAGVVAAKKFGAAELVDPRPFTVGKLSETFRLYPNIGILLPAMGYGDEQVKDLETTINNTPCDVVVIARRSILTALLRLTSLRLKLVMISWKLDYPIYRVSLTILFKNII